MVSGNAAVGHSRSLLPCQQRHCIYPAAYNACLGYIESVYIAADRMAVECILYSCALAEAHVSVAQEQVFLCTGFASASQTGYSVERCVARSGVRIVVRLERSCNTQLEAQHSQGLDEGSCSRE